MNWRAWAKEIAKSLFTSFATLGLIDFTLQLITNDRVQIIHAILREVGFGP